MSELNEKCGWGEPHFSDECTRRVSAALPIYEKLKAEHPGMGDSEALRLAIEEVNRRIEDSQSPSTDSP